MAVRVRNPGNYSYGHSNEHNYRHNYGQANGWYSNGQRNRTSGYPWCNQTRSTENRSNRYYSGNNYNDRTRQRYGYGYRMSGFSKALVSIGVAAGTLLKATGNLSIRLKTIQIVLKLIVKNVRRIFTTRKMQSLKMLALIKKT